MTSNKKMIFSGLGQYFFQPMHTSYAVAEAPIQVSPALAMKVFDMSMQLLHTADT